MRHTLFVSLLAAPLLLVWVPPASANPPVQCAYGHGCGGFCLNLFSKLHQHGPLFNYGPYYGYPPFEPYGPWNQYLQYNPWYYGDGSGGHGKHLAKLHGLLDRDRCGGCGTHERLAAFASALRGLGHRDGCGTCGGGGLHANWLKGGWFQGGGSFRCNHAGLFDKVGGLFKGHGDSCKSCGHGGLNLGGHIGGGQLVDKLKCSSCRADATDPTKTDAVARYAGIGNPKDSDAFYAGLPSLDPTVVPAGK